MMVNLEVFQVNVPNLQNRRHLPVKGILDLVRMMVNLEVFQVNVPNLQNRRHLPVKGILDLVRMMVNLELFQVNVLITNHINHPNRMYSRFGVNILIPVENISLYQNKSRYLGNLDNQQSSLSKRFVNDANLSRLHLERR